MALSLNAADMTQPVSSLGYGSYVYADGMICFTSLYPNALYKPGFLPNIYFSCAARARAMSWQLLGSDWDEDSFSLEHGTLGRIGLSSTEDDG
ncbi:hypothetical protein MHAS_02727 [Mycolicibacterium hassiacum DSM 44199]|uniref:hypothetical protein n=1 Tax=Mycolicibacterium hassiacum TaxID=46351 RepID=UPI0003666CCE|nr:hypothetical protein [Mycolicibacterium hassiacum]MDA4088082.1 hypothetical protein [Mycolicibacterium hassiacum DSM 44199]VCT91013.1 hypothetical protein MHAS_02727 [Mycolicibacterium hassiacum DSM 44199]